MPKFSSGLGLRDPLVLSNVMGTKNWWRWIKGGNELWKGLGKEKYASHTP